VSFAGPLKGHKRCPMPVHVKMLRWKDLGAVSANEAACNSVSVWKLVCKWRRNTRLDMYEIMFRFFRKDGGWHHKWYSMNWQVCISPHLTDDILFTIPKYFAKYSFLTNFHFFLKIRSSWKEEIKLQISNKV
jgi:hypothetical protein